MRIACVHVPQFALQCATRIDPSLRGAPVAVVGGSDPSGRPHHGPAVHACSRAAWALGVRVGMAGTAARGLSSELRIVSADLQLERDGVRAIADALLGLSPVVDAGGRIGPGGVHLALYCEVPGKTRGTTFGDRVLDRLDRLGITARVGIADDRFTAWVAASHGGDARAEDAEVVSVPRGGSAAFLAPRPLALLAITPEVQHMLEALGVRTLGEFAALPEPSVARPLEADYQGLARGDSGHALRPYAPDAPIREDAVVAHAGASLAGTLHGPLGGSSSGSLAGSSNGSLGDSSGGSLGGSLGGSSGGLSAPAAIAQLAERIALRLAGRGRGAARLEVALSGEAGERTVPVAALLGGSPATAAGSGARRVLESAEDLAEAIGSAVGELGAVWRMRVVVTGEALVGDGSADAGGAAAAGVAGDAAGAAIAELVPPPAELAAAARQAGERDALSVVLATTGSLLGAARAEHRRTRRGKQRPRVRRERAAEAPVQPRLFKNGV